MWKSLGFAAALSLALPATSQAADLTSQVRAWRQAHERQVVGALADLVAVRSIAADPAGLSAAADQLKGELAKRGFETRLLSAGPGTPPIVYGALNTRGAKRTVVFYAHYDGQPVEPADWRSDPFKPVMRTGSGADAKDIAWTSAKPPFDPEWRLFGRGASDDKSSIVAFLSAFDALAAAHRKPSINIKVVWEGEEERGSPHLAQILRENHDLLAADAWLIGDGPVHQSRRRTIYFGARGNTDVAITVYGPLHALHSGHYGNWVPNPAAMAAELITQLRDPDGGIRIPGFSDDVRPITPAETQAIAALPDVAAALKQSFGVAWTEGHEGLTASTMRPALNVTSLSAGGGGRAIPDQAQITIDFRLVPDQTPDRVREKTEAYLTQLGWTVVHQAPDAATRAAHARIVKLNWGGGYPALRSDMTTPAGKAVIAAASRAAGAPVAVLPMMGGSVPIYLFADILKTEVIGLPISNHDNNQHASDENARLQNVWDGIETYAAMIGDLNW
jgi:acetylornithine deacetylase/succinyl-diaminopimelate desuccinylase-like protein